MISLWPFAPIAMLLRMVVRNGGVSLLRIPMLVAYLLRFLLFEPFRIAERLLFDKTIQSTPLQESPIFILGHWRSGTSHLQTLMSLDSRYTSSTIYRSFFSDSFYLTESWLKPILNQFSRIVGLRFSIQRSHLDLDIQAEGDLGLCCFTSPYSYTWGHLFPRTFGQWMQKMVLSPKPSMTENWLSVYDFFLRKLSYGAGGKRVVMKSPGDTGRLCSLAEYYPGAKFIYIHRTATEVFHSNRYLWNVILKENGMQSLSDSQIDETIIENYRSLLLRYAEQREQIPSEQLIEIQYSALRDDPITVLQKVYAHLQLGQLEEDRIRSFLETQPSYSTQKYQTSDEVTQMISREWSEVEKRFDDISLS